jgi:uncharacterized protein
MSFHSRRKTMPRKPSVPTDSAPADLPPFEPDTAGGVRYAPQQFSTDEERMWSMLAHISVLSNLITGFAGPVIALAIYLVFRDRSRYLAYQSFQSFLFQLIWWGGGGVLIGLMWAIVGALSALVVGIALIPLACVLTPLLLVMPILALIYGTWGAIQASQGEDFKYWLIGDWVRGTLTGD